MEAPIQLDWIKAKNQLEAICKQQNVNLDVVINTLNDLTDAALNPRLLVPIIACFRPLAPEIFSRWVTDNKDPAKVLECFSLVIQVFPSCEPLLEHFLALDNGQLLSPPQTEDVLLAIYRLLSHNVERYKRYLPAKFIFELMDSQVKRIRGLAVMIMALCSYASEATRKNWLVRFLGEESPEFKLLPLAEAKRMAQAATLLDDFPAPDGLYVLDSISPRLANIMGHLLIKHETGRSKEMAFVQTPQTTENLAKLARACAQGNAVLVSGVAGCGKRFALECLLAQLRPSHDVVRIHLGDQTDAKALIGSYTSGDQPGTFAWKAGILTDAVEQGKWIFIENLDQAPTQVLATLLPLLEKRQLLIPSRNESISCARGFQLFATIATNDSKPISLFGLGLWSHVKFGPLAPRDLELIIGDRFPLAQPLAEKLVDTYKVICESVARKSTRQLTTRDLVKWAARIQRLLETSPISSPYPPEIVDEIYRQGLTCFTSFAADPVFKDRLASIMAHCLEIEESKVALLGSRFVPSLDETSHQFNVGRMSLTKRYMSPIAKQTRDEARRKFALTNGALRLFEQVSSAVTHAEPLLLVGETGTGKTSMIQYLADMTGNKLVVINVSQQVEVSDLTGGYKPMNIQSYVSSLQQEFTELFDSVFSRMKNHKFLEAVTKAIRKNRWRDVIKLWRESYRLVKQQVAVSEQSSGRKRRRVESLSDWDEFIEQVAALESRMKDLETSLYFRFVEGIMVKAVRRGSWLLLDEINLAPRDTLEGIADLLLTPPSITLLEQDTKEAVVHAHPNFRLFSCMNPATDVGKKDLPASVSSLFTELYVEAPDKDLDDLRCIVGQCLGNAAIADTRLPNDISELFIETKTLASQNKLVDGAGNRPHFSMRTLTRTIAYAMKLSESFGTRRALYEGFHMSFLTLLDKESAAQLTPIIRKHLLGALGNANSVLKQVPRQPAETGYILFHHYWLRQGPETCFEDPLYVLTPSVETNLMNLARAAAAESLPILIQGPTSSGKTSMIRYLAQRTGHKLVRINNHEHTDLQEYIGAYITDQSGKLVFQEGVLVEACRKGYWLILDELNLAPTEVLEALNRLLDDNRELFIPETQEVVKPHPDFLLFATQNPPGLYAGRKVLSRAFRNRFLELHFDDIPQDELELILKDRCEIAPSYAKKIVDVYRELGRIRSSSRVFEQKDGFATLRDLFRWAHRPAIGYEELARNGYLLLCERVRDTSEKAAIQTVLEQVMRVKVDVNYDLLFPKDVLDSYSGVIWTVAMKRLFVLLTEAIKQGEPVLLVGETGCGKTTVCQVIAELCNKHLHVVNAHQNMEAGDLIGSQRPTRSSTVSQVWEKLKAFLNDNESSLEVLKVRYKSQAEHSEELDSLILKSEALFEWVDGPLVTAMKNGEPFLLDEISLADDSVLERLNSVLEPEKTLLLPEKGVNDIHVVATQGFVCLATMNPGGDYGKKELSPALRNRFTEIWVPSMDSTDDLVLIVSSRLKSGLQPATQVIVEFSQWFGKTYGIGGDISSGIISLRDVLHWVAFINKFAGNSPEELPRAIYHGGCMVYIDRIGSNALSSVALSESLMRTHRTTALEKLTELCKLVNPEFDAQFFVESYFQAPVVGVSDMNLALGDFKLSRPMDTGESESESFSFASPTSSVNAMRIARAMTIEKPILLEGSPGVGKTSIVVALAKLTGKPLTRINLSDQTELSDLFGSDTPKEGGAAGEFHWSDAPFLRAMRLGEWVLLDEMNLAPQAILEGLNSCLDHRGEVFIPELNRSFQRKEGFLVFAAQNPQNQGGGRKGLPKSFLNRFSVVYVDPLSITDLQVISNHLYPSIPTEVSHNMLHFLDTLNVKLIKDTNFGQLGAPFEFNLRTVMQWFHLCIKFEDSPSAFFEMIIRSRFRTESDRRVVTELFAQFFPPPALDSRLIVSPYMMKVGRSILERSSPSSFFTNMYNWPLQCQNEMLRSVNQALQCSWPVILVGPERSGKTSLIRYASFVWGMKLHEFASTADVDISDLLGEFEQLEESQQTTRLWSSIDELVQSRTSDLGAGIVELYEAAEKRDLDLVKSILKTFEGPEVLRVTQLISKYCLEDFARPQFRWFDGFLISALERGDWVVLDNANLCNASVLDRLNSLMEPNGYLLLNESVSTDGTPRKIVPHPNFRLFLTVDPKFGELSRAMRNRGVEIYMAPIDDRASAFDSKLLSKSLTAFPDLVQGLRQTPLSTNEPILKYLSIASSELRDVALNYEAKLQQSPLWVRLSFYTYQLLNLNEQFATIDDELAATIRETAVNLRRPCFQKYLQSFEVFMHNGPSLSLELFNPLGGDLFYEFNCACIISEIEGTLEKLSQNLVRSRKNSMSLLELSLLATTDSTIAVTNFQALFTAVSNLDIRNSASQHFLELLLDFQKYLSHKPSDVSRIPVYFELLNSEALKLDDKRINDALTLLGGDYDCRQEGFAMETLWKAFSSPVFTSEAQFECYCDLLELSKRFDQVSARLPLKMETELLTVKENISNLLADTEPLKSSVDYLKLFDTRVRDLAATLSSDPEPTSPEALSLFEYFYELAKLNCFLYPSNDMRQTVTKLSLYSRGSSQELSKFFGTLNNKLLFSSFPDPGKNINDIFTRYISSFDGLSLKSQFQAAKQNGVLLKLLYSLPESFFESVEDQLHNVFGQVSELVQMAFSQVASQMGQLSSLPDSWKQYAIKLLNLFLPTRVYDPAIRQHVQYDYYRKKKADIEDSQLAYSHARAIFCSDDQTSVDRILADKLSSLLSSPIPDVYRPEISEMEQLFGIFNAAKPYLTSDYLAGLNSDTLETWNTNLERIISRAFRYPAYQDLTSIFEVIVKIFIFAVNKAVSLGPSESLSWLLSPATLSSSSDVMASYEKTSNLIESLEPFAKDQVYLQILRVCSIHKYQEIHAIVHDILDKFYKNWSARRLKDDEDRVKKELGFTYSAESEESLEEQEFLELFPDFEKGGENKKESRDESQVVASELVEAHTLLFTESSLSFLTKKSTEVLSKLNLKSLANQSIGDTLPSLVLGLRSRQEVESNAKIHHNFYKDFSPELVKQAIPLIDDILVRINRFFELWPEHESLLSISNQCNDFLSLTSSHPTGLFLQKVEQIYFLVEEWQKFTTKDGNMSDLSTRLSGVIVSWRREELSTWPSLFASEVKSCQEQDSRFWFYLYETLIVKPLFSDEESSSLGEVVKVLVIFLSDCFIGVFEQRYSLLSIFMVHVEHVEKTNRGYSGLRNTVRNVLAYFAPLRKSVKASIEKTEKTLKGDLETIVKLASWRDVNVFALQQSAKRSHLALYKVVRKFRQFLKQNVNTLNAFDSAFLSTAGIPVPFAPLDEHACYVELFKSGERHDLAQLWQRRSPVLQNIEKRVTQLSSFTEEATNFAATCSSLALISSATVAEAKQLRADTPKVLNEETKKVVASLNQQKALLFTSTLKSLRQAGVSSGISMERLNSQRLMSDILAITPHIEDSDDFFNQIVHNLPELRAAAASHNSTLAASDIRKGVNTTENLVYSILKERTIMDSSFGTVEKVAELRNQLSSIVQAPEQDHILRALTQSSSKAVELFLDSIPQITEFAGEFENRGESVTALLSSISLLKDAPPTQSRLEGLTNLDVLLKSFVNETRLSLIKPALEQWSEKFPPLDLLDTSSASLEALDDLACDISKSILVVMQRVVNVASSHGDEEKWFSSNHRTMRKLAVSLSFTSIYEKLAAFVEEAIKYGSRDTQGAMAMASSLVPFVNCYFKLHDGLKAVYLNFLNSNTKAVFNLMSLLLEVCQKGFCSPEEAEDPSKKDEMVKDGSGLGDGSGAQTNNDQEDFDPDDITEQAKEKDENEEDVKDENQEKSEAMDIEQEFEGSAEDASGSDNEESEPEDMDEDTGDVDDLDPSAVDEKMWDAETRDEQLDEKNTSSDLKGQEEAMEADQGESGDENDEQDKQDQQKDDGDEEPDEDAQEDNVDEKPEDGPAESLEAEKGEALELPEDMELDPGVEDKEGSEMEDIEAGEEDADSEDESDADANPIDAAREQALDLENEASTSDEEESSPPPEEDVPPNDEAENEPSELKNEEPEANPDTESNQEAAGSIEAGDNANDEDEDAHMQGGQDTKPEEDDTQEQSGSRDQQLEKSSESQDQIAETGGPDDLDGLDADKAESESKEALKQLGDALKEFFSQSKQIRERQEQDLSERVEESKENDPLSSKEFQHTEEGEDHDTQALGNAGNANNDQVIDFDMQRDMPSDADNDEEMADSGAPGEAGADTAGHEADIDMEQKSSVVIPDSFVPKEDMDLADEEPRTYSFPETEPTEPRGLDESRTLWTHYESQVRQHILTLTEQLRLILEPTLASKLQGDYKSGKRLNMKRVISYIASDYKKDKIWLRRTKPSKREYQVMIALDNSKSMGDPHVADMAFRAIALVSHAMAQLEVGQLCIVSFGSEVEIVHPFDMPFSAESGAQVLRHCHLDQTSTDVGHFLQRSLEIFKEARPMSSSREMWRLEFIISDGICEDHARTRELVRQAHEERIMLVFIVLDAIKSNESILSMSQANYITTNGETKLSVTKYLDTFPFEFYVIVRDIVDLPSVLASVLRQYFQVAESI